MSALRQSKATPALDDEGYMQAVHDMSADRLSHHAKTQTPRLFVHGLASSAFYCLLCRFATQRRTAQCGRRPGGRRCRLVAGRSNSADPHYRSHRRRPSRLRRCTIVRLTDESTPPLVLLVCPSATGVLQAAGAAHVTGLLDTATQLAAADNGGEPPVIQIHTATQSERTPHSAHNVAAALSTEHVLTVSRLPCWLDFAHSVDTCSLAQACTTQR